MNVAVADKSRLQPGFETVAASLCVAPGTLTGWARDHVVLGLSHHHAHLWGYHRPTGW